MSSCPLGINPHIKSLGEDLKPLVHCSLTYKHAHAFLAVRENKQNKQNLMVFRLTPKDYQISSRLS